MSDILKRLDAAAQLCLITSRTYPEGMPTVAAVLRDAAARIRLYEGRVKQLERMLNRYMDPFHPERLLLSQDFEAMKEQAVDGGAMLPQKMAEGLEDSE